MIPSLHITGFKLFHDLELPRLGNLNLFVGKNNTGKTCLLEAVELYASSSPLDILRVASRRETKVALRGKSERYGPFEFDESLKPLLNLFHREHGRYFEPHIRLSTGNPEAEFDIRCDSFVAEILDHEARISEAGGVESASSRMRKSHLFADGLELRRGGKKRHKPLFWELFMRRTPFPEKLLEEGWLHPDIAPVAYLPARGFTNGEEKRLWDKATLADKDELLLEWLRFIEPEVRDLRYISDPDSDGDLPYIKINSDRGRTPLFSMGDGMARIFHIGLAMANASGGILLIDEFENGLHWEVQEQLWKALFAAANTFGTQVFATTHSIDCIRAFVQAQNDMLIPNKCFVYRLERRGEDIYAHEFSPEGLEAAIGQGIEVR